MPPSGHIVFEILYGVKNALIVYPALELVFVKYEVQQKAAKNPTPVSAAYV